MAKKIPFRSKQIKETTILLLRLEISTSLRLLTKKKLVFFGKSKEFERKTRRFGEILEEKLGFRRDLGEEKEGAHRLSKNP